MRIVPIHLLADLARGLESIAFPPHCALCGAALEQAHADLCAACTARVVLVGDNWCSRCGIPRGSGVGVTPDCERCAEATDGYGLDGVVALGKHEGALRELVLALKFGNHRALADVVAAWLVQVMLERGVKVDAVVAVPLGRHRRWERGYNQSEEIARRLAGRLGVACLSRVVCRARETPQQALLSEAARSANMRGAFASTAHGRRGRSVLEGRSVAIVDDVLTTGATMREVAKVLRSLGASRVVGAVVTRSTNPGM